MFDCPIQVVKGLIVKRGAEGVIKEVKDAKVAIYGQGLDGGSTETKGTVLIESAEQLQSFAKGEEEAMEKLVKAIAESGAKVRPILSTPSGV